LKLNFFPSCQLYSKSRISFCKRLNYYYKTKAGREVDFIAGRPGSPRMLVQVCESLADQPTRKRETNALAEAMSELNLSQGLIVTRNEDEQIQVDSGTIDVVPVWRFLLNLPESV
jgi:predicted AAA+ superfamily ATPase